MAKATCEKHKRFVPTCDPCKSAALRETVGFPAQGGPGNEPDRSAPLDACNEHPDGCPEDSHLTPAEEPVAEDAVPVADIPDYEPDEEEPVEPDKSDGEGAPNIPDGTPNLAEAPLVPSEGEPEQGPRQMSPIEMAVAMFPARLMGEDTEPFIKTALGLYLEAGLTPEDAVICVAGEAIHAEHGIVKSEPGEGNEAMTPEEQEAFDEEAFEAGVEAASEISSCIEDYNKGFNHGMDAARGLLTGYYAGDEDAVAFATMRWMEAEMRKMRK